MASRQEIKRLHVTRGDDLLSYEKAAGREPAFLISAGDGLYTIQLKPGQYAFFMNETGPGQAYIELVGGCIHDGEVISTEPEHLPEGATGPIALTLKLLLD